MDFNSAPLIAEEAEAVDFNSETNTSTDEHGQETETTTYDVTFKTTSGRRVTLSSEHLYYRFSYGDKATMLSSIGVHSGNVVDFGIEAVRPTDD